MYFGGNTVITLLAFRAEPGERQVLWNTLVFPSIFLGGGTCICEVAKGLQFNSIFPGNTCAVKELQLYVASVKMERPWPRVWCQQHSILMRSKYQESTNQLSTPGPVLNSSSRNAFHPQFPRTRAMAAFRASLFSHPLSRDGINKSMPLWLDSGVHQPLIFPLVNPQEHLSAGTRWCIVWRLAECSLSCFSMRSRDQ